MISSTIPSAMGNLSHYGMDPTYILASPEGYALKEPVNKFYLKKFYA
jgi:hypothetical protein